MPTSQDPQYCGLCRECAVDELIFDFFMENLATEFYNQGVYDSHRYLLERAEDLLGIQK